MIDENYIKSNELWEQSQRNNIEMLKSENINFVKQIKLLKTQLALNIQLIDIGKTLLANQKEVILKYIEENKD